MCINCDDSTKMEVIDSYKHRRTNGFSSRKTNVKVRKTIKSLILLGVIIGGRWR